MFKYSATSINLIGRRQKNNLSYRKFVCVHILLDSTKTLFSMLFIYLHYSEYTYMYTLKFKKKKYSVVITKQIIFKMALFLEEVGRFRDCFFNFWTRTICV